LLYTAPMLRAPREAQHGL